MDISINLEEFFPPPAQDECGTFTDFRPALLSSSKAYLEHYQGIVREHHRAGAGGREITSGLTTVVDELISLLYRRVCLDIPVESRGACALIAIGGYGRAELNPRSDIDIMFYYKGKDRAFAETVSERILYLMWDLNLDVGYSVRTEKDCIDIADQDATARTALLDSRFLVGDNELYTEFENSVLSLVHSKNPSAFIKEKLEENRQRLVKYGSSVFLLEPNVKEGEGGLRDLHTALWVTRVKFKARSLRDLIIKGIITENEGAEYEKALDYIWRIRNELHYLSSRKNEQISFDQQEQIADFLGYESCEVGLAVEHFMQDYYSHATQVDQIAGNLISKALEHDTPSSKILGFLTKRNIEEGFFILRGELWLSDADLFQNSPEKMIRAFLICQHQKVLLSFSLKKQIRENLDRINDKVRRSKVMADGFMEILGASSGVADTLRKMHELSFLDKVIPEFSRIYCKVQHDAYHIYTVDIHSLFAIEEVEKVFAGEYGNKLRTLTRVAKEVEKKDLLILAVLLHDIGKGEGKDHANKGANMVPTIARRLGLNKEDTVRLEFLVRNHLQMARISQSRDLHDDKLISDFSRLMEMSENLRMLYLLTFADLKAVGPDVWSDWKGLLLQELYEKTFDVLERGDFFSEKRSEKVLNRKKKVAEILEEEFAPRDVKECLNNASTRYVLSNSSLRIADHLRLLLSRGQETLAMNVEQDPESPYTNVIISTLDIPGLFSKITGVMASSGFNILGAQIYTQGNGIALDILQVVHSSGETYIDDQRWLRVKENLEQVIEGRAKVEEMVKKKERPSFLPVKSTPKFATRVDIDNDVSDNYTVIDIFAHDRVGLLYDITKTLKELGLYIAVSKISTKVDQAADTFYVQDIFGQKANQSGKEAEIKETLLKALSAE